MRKIKISVAIFISIFIAFYSRYYTGIYFDFNKDATVSVQVKTEEKDIYVKNLDDNSFKPFEVRGVEVSSSIPGISATNYAIDKETWLRWFKQIRDMGANTIRIPNIYDETFYNSFYEFNINSKEKLYLIQGVQVSDYANNSSGDAYISEFYGALKEDSILVIDVIHGKRNISPNKMKGHGHYRKDVSPWVLSYVVGSHWNPGTMAYTNHNKTYAKKYDGKYFKTSDDATVFEAMLAKIMDDMIAYESNKYKTQKIISFFNDPQNDPFVYEKYYGKQLNKFNILDAENIIPTDKLKSGYIATYLVYEFAPEFSNYFSVEQKLLLKEELETLNKDLLYYGYTQLLAKYHTMPVIIFGNGISSARGTYNVDGPITEDLQGEKLAKAHEDIINSGCNGSIISSWQDSWERRSWNTSYSVNVQENYRWLDVQTVAQGYGLLFFEPGDKGSTSYVDGQISEWNDEHILLSNNNSALSVQYDEGYMYFLVKKEGLTEKDNIIIPIDVTPNSGSKISSNPKLAFEREVDFIINISGVNKSRILVHERYDVLRQNYLMDIEGEDPYIFTPDKDSMEFLPIRMISENKTIIPEFLDPDQSKKLKLFKTFETGKLVHGNNNPISNEYNSLADFYYGYDVLEIRIPWQILNFSNPSKVNIHDDYYENYGVEEISISKISIGLGELGQNEPIKMEAFKLDGWGNRVSYHERLKKSYYILKDKWGNKNDN